MIQLKVNGVDRSFDGDPEMPLLWYLRDVLGLRDQVWVWDRAVRRLYRAQQRPCDPLLCHAHGFGRGRADHHH